MQIDQQWQLLKLIPAFPQTISSSQLRQKLIEEGGRAYSLRTIQRQLQSLSKVFELGFNKNTNPFSWHWKEGYSLSGQSETLVNLPNVDIGLASLSDAIPFEAYFYKELKPCLLENPLAKNQKLKKFDDDWFSLKATLIVDQTFIQWLLSCGDRVEVVSPSSIREWMADTLSNSSGYYIPE